MSSREREWTQYYHKKMHWDLEQAFIDRWKFDFPQERLLFLARIYANVELLGTRYSPAIMREVSYFANQTIRPQPPLRRPLRQQLRQQKPLLHKKKPQQWQKNPPKCQKNPDKPIEPMTIDPPDFVGGTVVQPIQTSKSPKLKKVEMIPLPPKTQPAKKTPADNFTAPDCAKQKKILEPQQSVLPTTQRLKRPLVDDSTAPDCKRMKTVAPQFKAINVSASTSQTSPEKITSVADPQASKEQEFNTEPTLNASMSTNQAATEETILVTEKYEELILDPEPSAITETKQPIQVAITTDPPTRITFQCSEILKEVLEEKIIIAAQESSFVPTFRGKPFLNDGALRMWCEDEKTLQWLKETMEALPKRQEGKYVVVPQSDMEIKVRSGILLPGRLVSDATLALRLLSYQNSWSHIRMWKLYTARAQKNGLFLIMGIPLSEMPKIMSNQRRLSYLMGSVYVRFFGPDGLSKSPPSFVSNSFVN